MKCEGCPALKTEGYEYPETYCSIYPEEDCVDFKDGPGCRHWARHIYKRVRENDEAEARQYDGIGEWYKEQSRKESAMREAINKELQGYKYGSLYICFKDDSDGHYYPFGAEPPGTISSELAGLIQMSYEEILEKESKDE